jgi:hypothetical protein
LEDAEFPVYSLLIPRFWVNQGIYLQPQSKHTKTVVMRAQQNLFPLRRLKRQITGAKLPVIQDLYTGGVSGRP